MRFVEISCGVQQPDNRRQADDAGAFDVLQALIGAK